MTARLAARRRPSPPVTDSKLFQMWSADEHQAEGDDGQVVAPQAQGERADDGADQRADQRGQRQPEAASTSPCSPPKWAHVYAPTARKKAWPSETWPV